MSDNGDSRKPSIPAWQRTKPTEPVTESPTSRAVEPKQKKVEDLEELASEAFKDHGDDERSGETAPSIASQLEHVDALLRDPSVQAASMSPEKKRAFLESKSIPKETIDQALAINSINTSDFGRFQQAQNGGTTFRPPQATTTTTTQPPAGSSPPIITYPEFLVRAHKPPPLITPQGVLTATYFAGGLGALLYEANKFLVTPMVESLTECRHDFAAHSQSKLDEFNERLGKIVTRLPSSVPKSTGLEAERDELESVTSDPTELFHRDIGTQTSPTPSRRSSTAGPPTADQHSTVDYQTLRLRALKERLTFLMDELDSGRLADEELERQQKFSKLRDYLYSLMYGNPSINVWNSAENLNFKSPATKDDAVEELKREIRNIKGVLLSARRFPGPTARAGT